MAEKPTKTDVKKVVTALKRSKKKVVRLEALSRLTGIYPEILGARLSYFEPMILLDESINCKDFLPALVEYLEVPSDPEKERAKPIRKKDLEPYGSVTDFVYKKLTSVGGLVDPTIRLSDDDLAILKRLIENEQKKRRGGKKR
ncbi:MAG: hypothetical protein K6B65_06225 [Bacilli bacterium]|nr:hypothetical protein [Bacilli bacterium]